MNQGLLVQQESSIADYNQIWTRWTGSLSWWQWVQCLVRKQEWVANRIWSSWDCILHCWNQTQVKHCNTVPEFLEYQLNDFVCICMNWVEAKIMLSQSSWLLSNNACSRQLWHWLSFSKMLPSFVFVVVSISRNTFFFFVLIWEAEFSSRFPINDATRWWGSELQWKIISSTRSEEVDTDIETCFPIQVFVFVSLKVSSWAQIDSKPIIAKFLKSFCSLVHLIAKDSSF